MKAHFKAFAGRLMVELEASNVKELFREIGEVASVLDADSACGKCLSQNIYPNVRRAQDKYDYYELTCSDCGARLDFGQNKDGSGLFAKRNDDKGKPLDYHGWYIFLALPPSSQPEPSSAPRSAPPSPHAAERGNGAAPPRPSDQHEPPELIAYFKKLAISAEEREFTLGDLLASVRHTHGEKSADAHWKAALTKHGDPMTDLGRARNVARYLFNANKVQEELPLS